MPRTSAPPSAVLAPPAALSDSARQRAAGLRHMKRVATGLLVVLAVVFAVAFPLQDVHPVWGFVRAAAEGGMVGALADWFAVTALFRHPAGVPVPHTALIPRKKDQLGAALTEFVQENFLDSDVAREKVEGLEVAHAVGGWLRRRENAARMAGEVATAARSAMAAADDDAVQELLQQLMQTHMVEPDWSPTLAGVLEDVLAGRHHVTAVDLLVAHTGDWVAAHPEVFLETVRRRSPEWSPELVDRLLAERLHAEALKYLAGVRGDPHHEARRSIDDWLARLAADLRADTPARESVERFKRTLFADENLRAWVGRAWAALRDSLLDALEDPSSDLHRALVAALEDLGARLQEDPVLRARVDERARRAAAYALSTYGPALTGVIEETVSRWDGEQTARTLELLVGRDLQFIRINGSVVGALAGLGIHTLATLLF
ncbi:DUF445 domain-containing protein [Micrococcus sp.]|uniref:DUF445 domain-containing protein n=1 Tax=Micrococcus sp. TaxID=1271 RepID=UPI002A91D302|nr:DUF445 domain-containing protein [Micrococcus sp.]MDY6056025.1 DUF445 domain-containing protein [Micrococcus sp.]